MIVFEASPWICHAQLGRPPMRMRDFIATLSILLFGLSTAPKAEDKKRAGESCTQHSECKGHCYKGKSQMRCVDCSESTIKDARNEIDIWCDNTKKTCSECKKDELWEEEFKTSIDAFRKCINAR